MMFPKTIVESLGRQTRLVQISSATIVEPIRFRAYMHSPGVKEGLGLSTYTCANRTVPVSVANSGPSSKKDQEGS